MDAMSFKFLSAVRCVSIQVRAARSEPEFPKPRSSAVLVGLGGQGETGRCTAGMSHLAPQGLLWLFYNELREKSGL